MLFIFSKSTYEYYYRSPAYGYFSQYAVDGKVETIFHSISGNAQNEWWIVDLGRIYAVAKMKVTLRAELKERFQYVKVCFFFIIRLIIKLLLFI